MAGRGKELTLPAWMTSGSGVPSITSESQSISEAPATTITSPVSASFAASSAQQQAPPLSSPPASLAGLPGPKVPSFPPPIMPPFAPPRFPPMGGFPFGMPPGSMPMPGAFTMPGFFPGMMPPMMAPPRFMPPPLAAGPGVGAPTERTTDPNNDITCWTEHKTEDGRRYWYNSVTLASTYEKPLCLKTPEERSIPPCPWKEYTSPEGKLYYSNGTDSSWTMPEEYRIWKEKIDTIEKRLLEKKEAAKHDSSSNKQHQHNQNNNNKYQSKSNKQVSSDAALNFANATEAMEAFKEMLSRYEISATAKMKEVTDICSEDAMWNAVSSNGERKQALAEYQTKRLKMEKEEMKNRQRKRRDAFLHMLAENTEIDARTRWRTAQDILKDDVRYKNVEDNREREDLFQEFIQELEKKEREDRHKNREKAVNIFKQILHEMRSEGVIHSRSIWSEHKDNLMTLLTQRPDLKLLDESDIRRLFVDLTALLKHEHQLQERKAREEHQRQLENRILEVKTFFESLLVNGYISAQTRWKDFMNMSIVTENSTVLELKSMFVKNETAANGVKNETAPSARAGEEEYICILHQTFDRVLSRAQESYREDKKLVKRFLSSQPEATAYRIEVNSTFDELNSCILAFTKLREKDGKQLEVIAERREEGEEVEEGEERDEPDPPSPAANSNGNYKNEAEQLQSQLQQMMLARPATLKSIFQELHQKAVEEYEEEERYKRKQEEKYMTLLREYFYLSDHINITWEEAKPMLQQRSAYDSVGKHERKRLFALHMSQLRVKMDQRTQSMKASIPAVSASAYNGAGAMEVDSGRGADTLTGKKRDRSESLSRHHQSAPDSSKDRDSRRGRGSSRDRVRSFRSRERSSSLHDYHRDRSRDRERDGGRRSKDGRR